LGLCGSATRAHAAEVAPGRPTVIQADPTGSAHALFDQPLEIIELIEDKARNS
jgi:hypothetical protein